MGGGDGGRRARNGNDSVIHTGSIQTFFGDLHEGAAAVLQLEQRPAGRPQNAAHHLFGHLEVDFLELGAAAGRSGGSGRRRRQVAQQLRRGGQRQAVVVYSQLTRMEYVEGGGGRHRVAEIEGAARGDGAAHRPEQVDATSRQRAVQRRYVDGVRVYHVIDGGGCGRSGRRGCRRRRLGRVVARHSVAHAQHTVSATKHA